MCCQCACASSALQLLVASVLTITILPSLGKRNREPWPRDGDGSRAFKKLKRLVKGHAFLRFVIKFSRLPSYVLQLEYSYDCSSFTITKLYIASEASLSCSGSIESPAFYATNICTYLVLSIPHL
jgi:hypothetical protein